MRLARSVLLALLFAGLFLPAAQAEVVSQSFALPQGGGHPHDVAVDADGIAWYTAQRSAGWTPPRARSTSSRSAPGRRPTA